MGMLILSRVGHNLKSSPFLKWFINRFHDLNSNRKFESSFAQLKFQVPPIDFGRFELANASQGSFPCVVPSLDKMEPGGHRQHMHKTLNPKTLNP
jgi:hypothetical protein